jgi:hypothetical protein
LFDTDSNIFCLFYKLRMLASHWLRGPTEIF